MCGVAVLVGASDASAQMIKWTDSGFVAANMAVQTTGQDLNNSFSFPLYGETATVDAKQRIEGGLFFDMAFGKRLWNNLGAGFTLGHRSQSSDVPVTASIPDPIFFDQPRTVTQTLTDMKFSETLFAPIVLMGFPVNDVIDAIGFIGPVVRHVNQDVLSSAPPPVITEGGTPSVALARATITKNLLGVQIGVDVRYLLTKEFGVGGFIRYTGGGGNLNSDLKIEAPGVQIGVGARYRF